MNLLRILPILSLALALVFGGPIAAASAQSPVVVVPESTACGLDFGRIFDLEGDVAVVARRGAPAWLFERRAGAWVEAARLGREVGDTFGSSLAVSNGWIAIGEPGADERRGAVLLFRRDPEGWGEAARLVVADAPEGLRLGSVVALDRGLLAVRAAGDRALGDDGPLGSVRVFELDGSDWVQRARLAREGTGDAFGAALCVDGERVLVGAPADSEFRGGAYLFERGEGDWSRCSALGAEPRWEGDFGRSLALDGDWAAVGSWGGLPDNTEHGVVLFRRDGPGWTEVQRLEVLGEDGPLRGVREPWFGSGLALSAVDLVVGASLVEVGGVRTGAVYHYNLDPSSERWVLTSRLALPEVGDFRAVGAQVALDGRRVWIGAPASNLHHDSRGCHSGAVLVYELAP